MRALLASPAKPRVICAPGNAGIADDVPCVPVAADDVGALVMLAQRETVELVVVGPEVPLSLGLNYPLSSEVRRPGRGTFDASNPTTMTARYAILPVLCTAPVFLSAQLSILSQFDPSNTAGTCGIAYNSDAGEVLVYGCFSGTIDRYNVGGTFLSTVPPTAGLVAKFFGPSNMATLFGIVMLTHQVGGFLGAWLGGQVFEATGSYDWIWYIDIVLAVGAALVHLPIREAAVPVAGRPAAA